jgi:hypothetical protein
MWIGGAFFPARCGIWRTMDDSYFVKVYARAIGSGLTREEAKRTATKMKS